MKICGDDHARLERGRQQIFDAHGDDPNVTGVGIGFRRRAGDWTGELAVVVLVAKKRPAALVSRRRMLPRTVRVDDATYQVDVLQAGPFSAGAEAALAPAAAAPTAVSITERMRPPRQGASISNPADGAVAGTLGLFVVDDTDDTVCLLTCNHVIARMGRGEVGQPIIQPGGYDGGGSGDAIATLKRWAPIPASGTRVDGAIAQLTDQSAYTLEVARDLMAPISASHPPVAMVVAGDMFGGCLLTRMDATLDALDVHLPVGPDDPVGEDELYCDGIVPVVADPQPGMHIEKVGRTSGYTSTVIQVIGVRADVITPIGVIPYHDLVYTEFFSVAGDSGSVAFSGGDGNTPVPDALLPPCAVLGTLSEYYDLPLTEDNALADKVRDEFFLQTETGKFLVQLTYVNSESLITRLKDRQATADEIAYANEYYTKYHDFMAGVLADPASPEVVTEDHLNDAYFVIDGLSKTVLTSSEGSVALQLFGNCLVPTLGMNRQEVQAYMANPGLYNQVYDAVSLDPEIEKTGSFEHRPPEPTE